MRVVVADQDELDRVSEQLRSSPWGPRRQGQLLVAQARDQRRALIGALTNEIDRSLLGHAGREFLPLDGWPAPRHLLTDREADDPLVIHGGLGHVRGVLADRPDGGAGHAHPVLGFDTLDDRDQPEAAVRRSASSFLALALDVIAGLSKGSSGDGYPSAQSVAWPDSRRIRSV